MSKDELWCRVQESTYLTNCQVYDMIPLIRNNFREWGTYRGRISEEIVVKLNVPRNFANDIYDKINSILNVAKSNGVREIY
jgi:hypothetical protein